MNRFRTECLRELKKSKTAWRTLNCTTAKGALVVGPSHPAYSATRYERRFALRERWISRWQQEF